MAQLYPHFLYRNASQADEKAAHAIFNQLQNNIDYTRLLEIVESTIHSPELHQALHDIMQSDSLHHSLPEDPYADAQLPKYVIRKIIYDHTDQDILVDIRTQYFHKDFVISQLQNIDEKSSADYIHALMLYLECDMDDQEYHVLMQQYQLDLIKALDAEDAIHTTSIRIDESLTTMSRLKLGIDLAQRNLANALLLAYEDYRHTAIQ